MMGVSDGMLASDFFSLSFGCDGKSVSSASVDLPEIYEKVCVIRGNIHFN